jgi:hypothetical protein
MVQFESTASRLRTRFADVVNGLVRITSEIPVERSDDSNSDRGGLAVVVPDYHWGELTTEQRATQIRLKRIYESAIELLRLLLVRAPIDLVGQLRYADEQFRSCLELANSWGLSPDVSTNEAGLRSTATAFEQILAVLEVTGSGELFAVPDTNSLLEHPDPSEYRSIVGADAFVFMLLPTVLCELDRLKIEHRNPDLRDKRAITRMKGWRNQGSLSIGVTVDKSITVRACPSEPNMNNTLTWLDSTVGDDRIIASIIALQAEQPSSRVILVTSDINLQNKADAALIETVEF